MFSMMATNQEKKERRINEKKNISNEIRTAAKKENWNQPKTYHLHMDSLSFL